MSIPAKTHARPVAILALIGASACWGLSFPIMHALSVAQSNLLPGVSSWFITSWCLTLRFLIAALLVGTWYLWRGQLRGWTRLEIAQAVGLGIFTACGMLLQMDGLSYTSASSSAFITQSYCFFLPVFVALRDRRLPCWPLALGCVLVVIGIGILSGVDVRNMVLGRGEWETLAAAVFFSAQILWTERPHYASNHVGRVSALAFTITGALLIPIVASTAPSASALIEVYSSGPLLSCLAMLTLMCTLTGMVLMFTFQRHVGALGAAVIYCTEPLFASGLAFVLPVLLSGLLGISYANEHMTTSLLIGGLLVIAANLIVQIKPAVKKSNPA
jgi:drug/metabolite transporter (DMT)-like permease